ncbi:MAG: hypothetical protein WA874_01435 [Chryseosolibacter sp.]
MKKLIQEITPAIIGSNKLKLNLTDGNQIVVNPHILVRKKKGGEILKTMLDNGDCLDIPVQTISGVFILPESFAIDTNCLNFDYNEYELVFPKRGDWFEVRH